MSKIAIDSAKVLDHGEIALLDFMGSDSSIVDAARISYSGDSKPKTKDVDLLRFLMRNQHMTPFEMPELQWYVKAPIFVFRQWHRHRTASINEVSGRYSELPDEKYRPAEMRMQAKDNKQGSSAGRLMYSVQSFDKSQTEYQALLNMGVANEMARIVLPVATYSEMYWKCDLRNTLHFLGLRLDPHAQYEIRVYAEAMAKIIKLHFPLTFQAFEDYHLNAVTFTGPEIAIMNGTHGLTDKSEWPLSRREIQEFRRKLLKVKGGYSADGLLRAIKGE